MIPFVCIIDSKLTQSSQLTSYQAYVASSAPSVSSRPSISPKPTRSPTRSPVTPRPSRSPTKSPSVVSQNCRLKCFHSYAIAYEILSNLISFLLDTVTHPSSFYEPNFVAQFEPDFEVRDEYLVVLCTLLHSSFLILCISSNCSAHPLHLLLQRLHQPFRPVYRPR